MIDIDFDRRIARSVRVAGGLLLGLSLISMPVAAQSTFANAICGTGLGKLISMGIAGLSIMLAYYSIFNFYRGFKAGQKKQTGQRSQQGGEYGAGAKKIGGAVFISGAPTFLSAIGFTLLRCVSVTQIFA